MSGPASARRRTFGGMSALEFGSGSTPLELVFLHANGFHAALYANLLASLADRRRILAFDLRGHGETTLPADPASVRSFGIFVDDALRALEDLRSEASGPLVLAGHSLGASVSALASARAPERVRALALIEPVIGPPVFHLATRLAPVRAYMRRNWALSRGAGRRRSRFESRDAAFESYKGRGAFRSWPDEALRAYIEGGFKDDSEGGVVLRCAPAWEAAVYVAQGNDIWGALSEPVTPLVIRAGEHHSTFGAGSERLLRGLRSDADIVRVPGASHFLPMEQPDVARAAIEAALSAPPL